MDKVDYMKMMYDFHKEMGNNNFTLVYEGEITHQITKAFTSLAENNMDRISEDLSVKKKVFHVMVECLQNLSKHSEDNEGGGLGNNSGNGIFVVGRLGENNEDYQVITGNPIENDKIPDLKELLDKINQLDKEGLKEFYKKQMREGSLSDKGGAGLGLIDIARKTGEKLDYQFEVIDDATHFFLLRTKISRKESGE